MERNTKKSKDAGGFWNTINKKMRRKRFEKTLHGNSGRR